ncbi:hypothetical protein [Virgibacillus sp.]|uniref:hypothetical protein n=1 Tax=Virgibacillus sp. TaxID=1872700 RepID=UPI00181F6C80|nr:hypothetical protein [Virgibacillus sp.]NWO12705.1 hypothetical protein [Virgibacillus sp.]
MSRRMDITGERYGKLTVLEELKQHGSKRRWLCKCNCGNLAIVLMDSLRSGNTRSCGCLKPERSAEVNTRDLINKKFNKLTVIKKLGTHPSTKSILWLCKCECGNYSKVTTANLVSGNTMSCGCSRKRIDITSHQYGHLKVIKEVESKGYTRRWLCKCECGKEITVNMSDLRNGNVQSCGCSPGCSRKRIDITGHQYGRLKVIKEVESKGYTRCWLCKCECGKEITVRMSNLRKGSTQSCGCLRKERISKVNCNNLAGKRFGKLVVKKRSSKKTKSRKVAWECECDCGNVVIIQSDKLIAGVTKSCGCLRKKAGNEVNEHNKKHLFKEGVFTPLLTSKLRKDNKTGFKGVYAIKRKKGIKYEARINIKKKAIHLGTFATIEEAVQARKKAEEKYYKPYL